MSSHVANIELVGGPVDGKVFKNYALPEGEKVIKIPMPELPMRFSEEMKDEEITVGRYYATMNISAEGNQIFKWEGLNESS